VISGFIKHHGRPKITIRQEKWSEWVEEFFIEETNRISYISDNLFTRLVDLD